MSDQEESKDPFFEIHSVVFKKLRNKKKKLDKIKNKEHQHHTQGRELNDDEREMIKTKGEVQAEVD